jgi:hypothetical protein
MKQSWRRHSVQFDAVALSSDLRQPPLRHLRRKYFSAGSDDDAIIACVR